MLASGGESAPAPAAGTVTVRGLASAAVAADGGPGELRAHGEIVNGTDAAIGAVVVEVTASTPADVVIARASATSRLEHLPPGESAPFSALFAGVVAPGPVVLSARVVSIAVPTLEAEPGLRVTVQPPANVTLTEGTTVTVSTTQLVVAGVVRNAGTSRIEVLQVAIAVYDANGDVVLTGFTNAFTMPFLVDDEPRVLGPGQSGSFEVLIPRGPIMVAGPGLVVKAWVEGRPAGS